MKAEARSDSAGSAFALLQVGLGRPHGGVVGHVVVGGEELHLLPVETHTHRSTKEVQLLQLNPERSGLTYLQESMT